MSVKTKGLLAAGVPSDGRRRRSAAGCGLSGAVDLNESFSLGGATYTSTPVAATVASCNVSVLVTSSQPGV